MSQVHREVKLMTQSFIKRGRNINDGLANKVKLVEVQDTKE